MTSILKLTCVLSAATYALISGVLSPGGFGVSLTLLCVGGVAVLWIALSKQSRKVAAEGAVAASVALDESTRKRRLRAIRFYQGWIALSIICLICALSKAGTAPRAPLAVGVVMNLLFIFGCVQTIKRLRRTLN